MMKMIVDALIWLFANLLAIASLIVLIGYAVCMLYICFDPKSRKNFWLNNRA